MNWDNTSQITGTGSIYAEAATTSSGTSSSNGMIATPFIDFQNGNALSIMYKLNSKTATFIKQ